ncbi:hypothetical protein, partial [uncultured Desulfovibrio sp.]|uniref:hypothetical protein n=1 Tax=uncultured Desulfovibrio sp. TaxID=167968 RepID=UPI00261C518F
AYAWDTSVPPASPVFLPLKITRPEPRQDSIMLKATRSVDTTGILFTGKEDKPFMKEVYSYGTPLE